MNNRKRSILDNLRPNHTESKKAKTIEHVAAIKHTTDAVGWRPVPYVIPEEFDQFISELDSDVESFIEHTKPDKYNARFFEEIIDKNVELAEAVLAAKVPEHERLIHLIRVYQTASMMDLELHLQRMQESLEGKGEM